MILFTYGTLRKEKRKKFAAETRGELRDKNGQAIARFDRSGIIIGSALEVSQKDLVTYDKRETGYKRVDIETSDDFSAQAYQYEGEDFDDYPIVASGDWYDRN